MAKNNRIKLPETVEEAREIVKNHVVEKKTNISDNYILAYVMAKDNAEDTKWLVDLWESHAQTTKDGQAYFSAGTIDLFLERFPEVKEIIDQKAKKKEDKKKVSLDDMINKLRKELEQ